jgi:nucleoside-diphosphate-sugar epimerase
VRILVTGASGFVGRAVVPELLSASHQVLGLARSDAAAAALTAAGAQVHRGDLTDLAGLRAAAEASDGVVHLAYVHDFSDMAGAARTDLAAVGAFADVLRGSDRPLVIVGGVLGLATGRPGTELDEPAEHGPAGGRATSARAALALAGHGVRSSVVRLAPTVHDRGDRGFVPTLVDVARTAGVSRYVGDGTNRWPAVHRLDAARLFRLAVESAPAGSTLHGVAEEGVATREIAETIGHHLGVPTTSVAPEDAAAHFGWIGAFFGADLSASSTRTQELLGWRPTHPGLVEDLAASYFTAA